MAEFPALPIWTDAYLADTRHLSTLEHGAYFLLMMEAWRRPHCSLPDDDAMLARLAGVDTETWAAIRPIVMAMWKLDGRSKTWTQKRLLKERDFVRKRSKKQSDNATSRWNKKKKPDAMALPDECQTDAPTPTPIYSVTSVTGAHAPPDDPVKELFDAGVALLTGSGMPAGQARSLIGKWRKEQGDIATLAAVVAARDHCVSNPVEWVTGRFRAVAGEKDEEREISRATAERYRRMDIPGPPPGLKH